MRVKRVCGLFGSGVEGFFASAAIFFWQRSLARSRAARLGAPTSLGAPGELLIGSGCPLRRRSGTPSFTCLVFSRGLGPLGRATAGHAVVLSGLRCLLRGHGFDG